MEAAEDRGRGLKTKKKEKRNDKNRQKKVNLKKCASPWLACRSACRRSCILYVMLWWRTSFRGESFLFAHLRVLTSLSLSPPRL